MWKGMRRSLCLGLAVAFAILLPNSAQAATASDEATRAAAVAAIVMADADPKAAFERLSASEQNLFRKAVTPVKTISKVTPLKGAEKGASVAYTGCRSFATWLYDYNVFGATLYSYGQETQVCAVNNQVVSVSVYNVWQSISMSGWRYSDRSIQTYNAGWEGRGLVQWHFILGVGGWDVQHTYPCLQVRLNGNGYDVWIHNGCSLS